MSSPSGLLEITVFTPPVGQSSMRGVSAAGELGLISMKNQTCQPIVTDSGREVTRR